MKALPNIHQGLLVLALIGPFMGCDDDDGASLSDARAADDGASPDAAPLDGSLQDAAPLDGSLQDAAPLDGSLQDAAPLDGSLQDAAEDGASPDAAPHDAAADGALLDASPRDAAPLCLPGETRAFRCDDGVEVPWCTCEAGDWQCVTSPELGCRDQRCDDGAPITCDDEPYDCEPGAILALRWGCYVCLNPVSCEPWGAAGCQHDGDCTLDHRCDPCATSSCPDCDDCLAACVPHGCFSGQALTCERLRPACVEGQTAIVQPDGCWACVALDTCEPPSPTCEALMGLCVGQGEGCPEGFEENAAGCPEGRCCEPQRDHSCDDGTALSCSGRPSCLEGELLALQGGCFECVNPATCRPWSEPGCAVDADCGLTERCELCAYGSCPSCGDCVAACVPHDCDRGLPLECDQVRPQCPENQTAVVREGCWLCVFPENCEPPLSCAGVNGTCTDAAQSCGEGSLSGPHLECEAESRCCIPEDGLACARLGSCVASRTACPRFTTSGPTLDCGETARCCYTAGL